MIKKRLVSTIMLLLILAFTMSNIGCSHTGIDNNLSSTNKENEFYGIKTIEATAQQAGSYAIRIDCTSYRQFEISYADKNEEAYNGERKLPINSDLGEYVIKVHLMDTPNVSESFGKGHKIWTTYELTETGDQLRYMYCYTPDHGVLVYIGSDAPMHYTIPEQKEKGSIEFSVNFSDSDISVPGIIETETTTARRVYYYFEDYFPYMNDLIEGKFISYKIENGRYYYTFEVLKDYRETGLRGEVTVRDTPALYSFAKDGSLHGITGFSTYDVPFSAGVSYLLALRRYSSTFNEEKENFFFTEPSLIIPAQGYEKSAVLYGTPLREHIKTQEALEAFDNGRLAEYILEAIRDNPRLHGTPYTKITTLKELLDFSGNVFKVKVNMLRVYSLSRDRISGYCTVEDVLKGECGQSDVEIVFPMGQVEEGADYIVAVRGSGSFFVASTMNSVFDCSEYDAIKELIDNE